MMSGIEQMVDSLRAVEEQVGRALRGKGGKVRLALCCLLAQGHLLIEDIPGVGKTTLAKALSHALGLSFRRVQFTSDLLPGDILGASVFSRDTETFVFHPGPIFTQVFLADEINRATPKTQSALLEAMEEGQVSVEGKARLLPSPFFVLATQNPLEQWGTFPLPESQLDRFLMRLVLGYPPKEQELEVISSGGTADQVLTMDPVISPDQLVGVQKMVMEVTLSEALLSYVHGILSFTRESGEFAMGLSPRAGIGLARAAQAWAFFNGRDYVLPEDVQTMIPPVVGHRLRTRSHKELSPSDLDVLVRSVAVS